MKIAIGSDHRGLVLKQKLVDQLAAEGHTVIDVGTDTAESVDYPDFATPVCHQVLQGHVDRGVLICGTGIGMSMAANRFAGIRAAVCSSESAAKLSRQHNDANIVCLSADLVDDDLNQHMVDVWLQTAFEGGRHQRRVSKIEQRPDRTR